MLRLDAAEEAVAHETLLSIMIASTVGASIEWLDFFYYSFLAMTVFPAIFFPGMDPYAGVVAAFTANFVGFLARPLGGLLFGYFGDRVGRKSTLVSTLLLLGTTTMLMGVLPDYATWGIAAPILLALLRFLQGIGVGGEWGGSVLLTMEFGSNRRRGFLTSWPQTGAFIGLGLSAASLLLFKNLYPGSAFQDVGWRMPFLLSTMLLLVGLYIRLRVPETPAFLRMKARQQTTTPADHPWKCHWPSILLSALVRSGEQAPFYIFTMFMLTYGGTFLHLNTALLYACLILAAGMAFCLAPLYGTLSDRYGRRRLTIVGALLMGTFAFPYFFLLNTTNPWLVLLATVAALGGCHALLYGPQAALIAERFPTRLRYTGATLSYQLASIIAGGPAPLIATFLLNRSQPQAATAWVLVALYILAMTLISLLAALFLKEYAGKAACEEPEEGMEQRASHA
jgi:MFS family permease